MSTIRTRGNPLDWLLNNTSPATGRDDHLTSPTQLSGPETHRNNGHVAVCLSDNRVLEVATDAEALRRLRQPDGRSKLWGWCEIRLAERLAKTEVKDA